MAARLRASSWPTPASIRSWTRRSTWYLNSRSRSCSSRARRHRKRLKIFRIALLPSVEDQLDCDAQPVPALLLDGQLLPARPRQGIELGFTAGFRRAPFRPQPASLFEAVQCGGERALVHLDGFPGDVLDSLRERIPMSGLEREDLQNQHVEGALRDRKATRRHIASTFDISPKTPPRLRPRRNHASGA